MPELPDVEVFGQYLNKTSLNQPIKNIEVKSPELLQNIQASKLQEKLEGHSFSSSKRYGKYLFINTDTKQWLILHFGMTGKLKYFKNKEEEPKYTRFLVDFENGFHLAFDDSRKFGSINFAEDIDQFIHEKNLGADAFDTDFKTFNELIKNKRGAIKTVLMNQHLITGIGNIYSDEILYQTCIHPQTKVNELNGDDLEKIFNTMRDVLQTAIDSQANPDKFPNTYLIPNRVKGGKCPKSNKKLKQVKVSGRTSYYCPECQEKKS